MNNLIIQSSHFNRLGDDKAINCRQLQAGILLFTLPEQQDRNEPCWKITITGKRTSLRN